MVSDGHASILHGNVDIGQWIFWATYATTMQTNF